MKVLFENKLKDAQISCATESSNYPVSNVTHDFLTKRFQGVGAEIQEIVIDFDDYAAIGSFFYSYTNSLRISIFLFGMLEDYPIRITTTGDIRTLTDGRYRAAREEDVFLKSHVFYNGETLRRILTDGTVRELTTGEERVTSVGLGVGKDADVVHFSRNYSVRKIIVWLYGGPGTYLGGIGAGVCKTFANPANPWTESFLDNSILTVSRGGQTLQNKAYVLFQILFTMRDVSREEILEVQKLLKDLGIGGTAWFDCFESNHDYMSPFYGIFIEPPMVLKNGRRFDYTLSIQEAR